MTDHTEDIPRTHYVLDAGTVADMLAELATARDCEDCTGGPAICVEGSEEWELVAVHDVTCPQPRRTQRLSQRSD